ncbi:MAG: DUF488 domain-containing protein [Phycisphaerae bacterium]
MSAIVYTIGHSTHSFEAFIALLERHKITAVADVRSQPYSRFNPQFDRPALAAALKRCGVEYVFLGEELGARPKDRSCYVAGRVSYQAIASSAAFQRGIERIEQGRLRHRITLMCAEKDPLACHRTILVARQLTLRGISVAHILDDGSLETHAAATSRLLAELGLPERDLFGTRDDVIADAFTLREREVAHEDERADGAAAPATEVTR